MRIQLKLFLASLLASAALVATLYFVMQWTVDQGMLRYVNQRDAQQLQQAVTKLADYYSVRGSWQRLGRSRRQFDELFDTESGERSQTPPPRDEEHRPPRPRDGAHRPPPNGHNNPPPRPRDSNGVDRRPPREDGSGQHGRNDDSIAKGLTLLDAQQQVVTGRYQAKEQQQLLPIAVSGEVVGWLVSRPRKQISDGFELQFLQQQQQTLALVSVIMFLLSALLSFLFARHLVGPIKVLASGAEHLTQGDYSITLAIPRKDELGQLARDFNELAFTLARNDDARKRWFADISHELRTPLAVLKGEIEAMLDGVRPLDPTNLSSLGEEVAQLTRLIEDLYELSNSDIGGLDYRKSEVDFVNLVQSVVAAHQPNYQSHDLQLSLVVAAAKLKLWADEGRLRQLLDNLLTNAMKYTDRGGKVTLQLRQSAQYAQLTIADSAPGVDDNQLSQLFDHLYRTEPSRNRASGGSGLGLAICRRIVEAHKGTIEASHSLLGGLQLSIELPLNLVE